MLPSQRLEAVVLTQTISKPPRSSIVKRNRQKTKTKTNRQTNREADRQANGQARQTDRQIDRQTK